MSTSKKQKTHKRYTKTQAAATTLKCRDFVASCTYESYRKRELLDEPLQLSTWVLRHPLHLLCPFPPFQTQLQRKLPCFSAAPQKSLKNQSIELCEDKRREPTSYKEREMCVRFLKNAHYICHREQKETLVYVRVSVSGFAHLISLPLLIDFCSQFLCVCTNSCLSSPLGDAR